MIKIFLIIFLSNTYPANIITNIHPDTIYVGSVGILSIYINKISTWLIIVAGCYIIYYWLTYGELMLKMKFP